MHKKVLKEEVRRLRHELNELELKSHSKAKALKDLAEFFNSQTLPKIKQIE